jgi:hypothetical protein
VSSIARTLIHKIPDLREDLLGQLEHAGDMLVSDLVIDELPVPLFAHQATIFQTGKVGRGIRLGEAGEFDDIRDTPMSNS